MRKSWHRRRRSADLRGVGLPFFRQGFQLFDGDFQGFHHAQSIAQRGFRRLEGLRNAPLTAANPRQALLPDRREWHRPASLLSGNRIGYFAAFLS
jgi:hypothetical protein